MYYFVIPLYHVKSDTYISFSFISFFFKSCSVSTQICGVYKPLILFYLRVKILLFAFNLQASLRTCGYCFTEIIWLYKMFGTRIYIFFILGLGKSSINFDSIKFHFQCVCQFLVLGCMAFLLDIMFMMFDIPMPNF